jgi:hypothetical protein
MLASVKGFDIVRPARPVLECLPALVRRYLWVNQQLKQCKLVYDFYIQRPMWFYDWPAPADKTFHPAPGGAVYTERSQTRDVTLFPSMSAPVRGKELTAMVAAL